MALRDDEAEVRQAVEECAAAVGSSAIDLSAVLDVLLPVLRGEVRSVGAAESQKRNGNGSVAANSTLRGIIL